MEQLAAGEIGIEELSVGEIEEVSGGILCVLVICFSAGFYVGTKLYDAVAR
jgi:hypothetical protein